MRIRQRTRLSRIGLGIGLLPIGVACGSRQPSAAPVDSHVAADAMAERSVEKGQLGPSKLASSNGARSVTASGEMTRPAEPGANAASPPPETRSGADVAPESTPSPPSYEAPAPVEPPFHRSAKTNDGQWRPYGDASEDGLQLWVTNLHPHPISSFVTVTIVAMDLRHVRLDWVVGASDEGASNLAGHMVPGLLSQAALTDAIAVFNGGFQARHGWWGQVSHGVTLVNPKPLGCGVALDSTGNINLGLFDDVAQTPTLVTYRQTPPCLVSDGELNPALVSGNDKVWAGKSAQDKTRRRSALGLSRETSTLYYLVGVEAEPIDLGRTLVALGADVGLQLDINWNWTRFFLVGQDGGSPSVHTPLVDGMVKDTGEYLKRPSKRDFFVVVRRR